MHLADDGDSALGQPLDDRHLPQGLVEVERTRKDASDVLAQPVVVAGTCESRSPDVKRQIEVGIVNPHRLPEIDRSPKQLLSIAGNEVKPFLDGARES